MIIVVILIDDGRGMCYTITAKQMHVIYLSIPFYHTISSYEIS